MPKAKSQKPKVKSQKPKAKSQKRDVPLSKQVCAETFWALWDMLRSKCFLSSTKAVDIVWDMSERGICRNPTRPGKWPANV